MKEKNTGVLRLVLRVLQGMLIGVGAVLPGISGGVLCVVFGIYKPIMELLSSPIKKWKTHVPRLLPVIVGAALGFLGAKVLALPERDPTKRARLGPIAACCPPSSGRPGSRAAPAAAGSAWWQPSPWCWRCCSL
ncbi:MAG: undecaprenyl phosphate translocase family protein [Acutalibacter sp.]